MIVAQVLKAKGNHQVETIAPEATVADAAKKLAKLRIGALVVADATGAMLGIVSERDLVRVMAESGAASLNHSIASLMTTKVQTCTLTDQVAKVMQTMTNGRFRHMPVVDGGKMTGLISIGDVVKARMSEIEMENAALADWIKSG